MTEQRMPTGFERRREDDRLITGRGQYIDDLRPPAGRPEPLVMAVVRSVYAHARIGAISTDGALASPGVFAVLTGRELADQLKVMPGPFMPIPKSTERRPLVVDIARYAGDPVAVVLATDSYLASDARLLVEVEYEPLPAVTDLEEALRPDAPILYPEFGSNEALAGNGGNAGNGGAGAGNGIGGRGANGGAGCMAATSAAGCLASRTASSALVFMVAPRQRSTTAEMKLASSSLRSESLAKESLCGSRCVGTSAKVRRVGWPFCQESSLGSGWRKAGTPGVTSLPGFKKSPRVRTCVSRRSSRSWSTSCVEPSGYCVQSAAI